MTTPPTNLSSGTLTGATWIVGANSSMSLGANVTTDAATIILNGAGASFSSLSKLAKVAAGGSLQVLGGASLATTANLDNAGTISLSPGVWNVTGNYTQEATGALDVGVGGLAAGSQFGQLKASGQVARHARLNLSVRNAVATKEIILAIRRGTVVRIRGTLKPEFVGIEAQRVLHTDAVLQRLSGITSHHVGNSARGVAQEIRPELEAREFISR